MGKWKGSMKKEKKTYRIEQRNKYLEDIGLPPHMCGTNFMMKAGLKGKKGKKRIKGWEKQQKKYGFDDRETYCLNEAYEQWLYSHLKMFLEKADGTVNLDYYEIAYEGKTYTQKEFIIEIMKLLEFCLKNTAKRKKEKVVSDKLKEATNMWAEILPLMWW